MIVKNKKFFIIYFMMFVYILKLNLNYYILQFILFFFSQ